MSAKEPQPVSGRGLDGKRGRRPRRTVVLYNPRSQSHVLPLALVHLGSMLPNHAVEIVDGRVEMAPETRIAELVDQAVCLGVSVLSGAPILDALRITRAAKARRPSLPVIWGGWHPSLLPEQCLASGLVDACAVGQGEWTFAESVARLERGDSLEGVAGLVFKRGDLLVRNPPRPLGDLNQFNQADFGLLDMERYFRFRGVRRLDYCSSQGCAFRCSFCAEPVVYGQRWKGICAQRVVQELAGHVERYRLTEISFGDDNFFTDLKRSEAICRGLLDHGVKIRWFATGRADLLSRLGEDQLRLLRQSGCVKIRVGVESGCRELLKKIQKGTRVEEVLETAEKLHRFGIGARFSFMAGFPEEPKRSLQQTFRVAKALKEIDRCFETPIYFYAPHPATELAQRMKAPGFTAPDTLEGWGAVDHSIGPWIEKPVRTWVPRYNFYLRHGYQPPNRKLARLLLHWAAKARVKTNFYRLDLELRAANLLARAGGALVRLRAGVADD